MSRFDDKLAPMTDGAMAPLYAGAIRGELDLPWCGACDTPLELEQHVCDRCGNTPPEWRATPARGHVHAATAVWRLARGLVHGQGPYHVVDVDLADGHRLAMAFVGAQRPAIGDPVDVIFVPVGGVPIPAAMEHHHQEESE